MIEFIREIAVKAGEISLAEFEKGHALTLEFKNDKDIVSSADKKIEDYLKNVILTKFPEHDFWGEETGRSGNKSEYCWVIDPIDGTTSFVHGQPFFSISIALQKNGETVAGAVHAPKLGELFYTEKGRGAFVNGRRLQVSKRDKLINSVLSTGFACLRAGLADNNLQYFNKLVPCLRGVRRYGSAALDLAFVAAGRLEGFWEMNLNEYDIAAGVLLVKEAGGNVLDFNAASDFPKAGTIATNGRIDKELLEFFK